MYLELVRMNFVSLGVYTQSILTFTWIGLIYTQALNNNISVHVYLVLNEPALAIFSLKHLACPGRFGSGLQAQILDRE